MTRSRPVIRQDGFLLLFSTKNTANFFAFLPEKQLTKCPLRDIIIQTYKKGGKDMHDLFPKLIRFNFRFGRMYRCRGTRLCI